MAAADAAPALILPFRLGGIGGALARLRRRRAPARLTSEALEFQDELERLIAEPPPPPLRGVAGLVALLFVALLALAAVARVDIVVTGSGRLAPDAPPIVLSPMERAVVRELRVRPGEVVQRGQVLALLDPTFAEADRATLAAQQRAIAAQLARLEAEAAGQALPPGGDPDAMLQAVLHAQRQALLAARLRGFEEELRGLEASIRTLEANGATLQEQVVLAREVEGMRARLLETQNGSRLNLLAARAQRLAAEQEQRQAENRMAELRHAVQAKRAERQTFLDDWRRQLLEETVRLRADLVRVEEQLAKTRRLGELTVLAAPRDGIVLEVARRSVGSVLREAEPLITLVPADAPLIAEIAVESGDIGYARAGDPVVLKVAAFPYQRHGLLHGVLRAVIQDSAPREGREARADAPAVHRVQVALEPGELRNLPDGARLIPGMTVVGEITVGSRTILSYFLDPLLRGLEESIREP